MATTKDIVKESDSIIENNAKTPTIDTNKKYPFKEFILNDLADITYIPIETNNDVLINNGINALSHFSDKYIIIVNYKSYDCYILIETERLSTSSIIKDKAPMNI